MTEGQEPPLEELIGDQLTQLMMASDRIGETELRDLLRRAAEGWRRQRATQPKRQRR